MLSVKLSAQTVVIPDPGFRTFLETYYPALLNSNKELITANAAVLTGNFYCGEANISSLEGIQYFVNIDQLTCIKNNLSTLPDLSALTKLTTIDCYVNQLTSLPSLNALVNLKMLNVGENRLTTLPALTALTNLTDLIVYRNQLTAIPDLSALTSLQRLYCFENQITSMGKMPATLKELWFGNNLMTHVPDISLCTGLTQLRAYTNHLQTVPDFAPYMALTELNLGTNWLTAVPASITSLTQLSILTLDNNQFTSLPDLSGLPLLTDCNLQKNAFTFEDLLPSAANPNMNTWQVSPQDSIAAPAYTSVTEGQPISVALSSDAGVPGLTFSWYRNGILAKQTNDPVLIIPAAAKADNGRWYCLITSSNPVLAACTLSSRMFTIAVRTDFTEADKEFTITPNGDGKNDEWLFEENGTLKVYNSTGMVLDQQTAPCYWNGTTSAGRPLGTGYYLIRINDDITYQITIIR